VAARHNRLRQSKSKYAKQKKADRSRNTYWVSITFLYSLVPHPQNLIGEGLLAHGSFVLLTDHLASFTQPSRLTRSWGLASCFFVPFLLFLATAAQYFLLKDITEIHQDCQGRLQPSRLPLLPLFAFLPKKQYLPSSAGSFCRQDSKHGMMRRRPQITHNRINPIFIKPLSQPRIPQLLKRLFIQPHPS